MSGWGLFWTKGSWTELDNYYIVKLLLPHVILGLNEPVTGVEELVVAVLLQHPRSLGNKSLSTYGCTEDSLEKKDKTKDCWWCDGDVFNGSIWLGLLWKPFSESFQYYFLLLIIIALVFWPDMFKRIYKLFDWETQGRPNVSSSNIQSCL